jgi:hypothetical protein
VRGELRPGLRIPWEPRQLRQLKVRRRRLTVTVSVTAGAPCFGLRQLSDAVGMHPCRHRRLRCRRSDGPSRYSVSAVRGRRVGGTKRDARNVSGGRAAPGGRDGQRFRGRPTRGTHPACGQGRGRWIASMRLLALPGRLWVGTACSGLTAGERLAGAPSRGRPSAPRGSYGPGCRTRRGSDGSGAHRQSQSSGGPSPTRPSTESPIRWACLT